MTPKTKITQYDAEHLTNELDQDKKMWETATSPLSSEISRVFVSTPLQQCVVCFNCQYSKPAAWSKVNEKTKYVIDIHPNL